MGEADEVDEAVEEVPDTHEDGVEDLDPEHPEPEEEVPEEVLQVEDECKTGPVSLGESHLRPLRPRSDRDPEKGLVSLRTGPVSVRSVEKMGGRGGSVDRVSGPSLCGTLSKTSESRNFGSERSGG